MPHADDHVLDRVRKLLSRAEHASTPPAEAQACTQKAALLMHRYSIDRAALDAATATGSAPQARQLVLTAPYTLAKAVLLDEVARAFRVRVAIGRGERERRCTMVGYATDLAATELLFTSLLLQAATAMTVASRGRPDVRAFRRAFLFGYAASVGARLGAARQDAQQEAAAAPGTAVVLRQRATEVDAEFSRLFPRLATLRTGVSSGGGLAAGHAAGAAADLSMRQSRLTAQRRAVAG